MTTQTITIYIAKKATAYILRYEFNISLGAATEALVATRLSKSFSLGRDYPDAYTLDTIEKKAKLMQDILVGDFGFTSRVINVTREISTTTPNT